MPEFLLMGMEGERLRLFLEDGQILEELAGLLEEEQLLTPEEKARFCMIADEEFK